MKMTSQWRTFEKHFCLEKETVPLTHQMTQRGKVTYYDAHKGQYCDGHFAAMTVLCVAILGNMTQPWRTIPGGQEVRLTNDKCIIEYNRS